MAGGYEFLDHTADVIVRAYGESWEEVFEALGKALFGAMLDVSKVEPRECREIKVRSESLEDLVVDFLNELLVFKDAEGMAFSHFSLKIEEGDGWKLEGRACGEKINPEKHQPFSEVKAVSYHMLEVGEVEGRKYAQVVFDL
ncbi:MAG: archease [Candidatus Diapherotrites archaeon]|nr:archease [Candidatus Diapherotrites archaeon]